MMIQLSCYSTMHLITLNFLTVLCMYHCMLDYKQMSVRLVACVYGTIYNIFIQDVAEGTATRRL